MKDTPETIDVLANDNFAGSVTVTAVTQGTNGTVTFLADGNVTYTPNSDFHGTDSFTYTVTTDEGSVETAAVSVTVNPLIDVVDDTLTTNEDTPGSINVLTSNDTFSGPVTITGVTQGANGTVTFLADGTVTYTPVADFSGTDSFTYTTTTDEGLTETATVNVVVNQVADVLADIAVTNEDTAVNINVSANDTFSTLSSVTSVTQGANGRVVLEANGTVTYTPDSDFHGTDSFTYSVVATGGVIETGTVTVVVEPCG